MISNFPLPGKQIFLHALRKTVKLFLVYAIIRILDTNTDGKVDVMMMMMMIMMMIIIIINVILTIINNQKVQ